MIPQRLAEPLFLAPCPYNTMKGVNLQKGVAIMKPRKRLSSALLAAINYGVYAFCWALYGLFLGIWNLPRGVFLLIRGVARGFRKAAPPVGAALGSVLVTMGIALVWVLLSLPDVFHYLTD